MQCPKPWLMEFMNNADMMRMDTDCRCVSVEIAAMSRSYLSFMHEKNNHIRNE